MLPLFKIRRAVQPTSKHCLVCIVVLAVAFNFVFVSSAMAQAGAGGGGGGGGLTGAGAYDAPAFAGGIIREMYCDIVELVEGSFGALATTAAAFLIMGYAALGDARKASTIIPVAVGAFAISGMVSIYFGTFEECGGNGEGAANRVIADAANETAVFRGMFNESDAAETTPSGSENAATGDPFADY